MTYAVHDFPGIRQLLKERCADTWYQPELSGCEACGDSGWLFARVGLGLQLPFPCPVCENPHGRPRP